MADYKRHYDEEPRRQDRDWSDRSSDEVRSWFGDDQARQRRSLDERDNRASRWETPREERDFSSYAASTGAYRTDDRGYHDRYRAERAREDGPADYLRWEARRPGAEFEDGGTHGENVAPWLRRERGGYWRNYEPQATYAGRGPRDYQRSDERIREAICDCMTDDPMLDASEVTVVVSTGEVTLSGTVTSREQKRRAEDVAERISGVKDVTNQLRVAREANGHSHTAAPLGSQASGNGTPSKSTSRTTT